MRETYSEISFTFEKSGKCSVCGKRRKRIQRFWQTYNPYNRRADGQVKTPQEIRDEVVAKGRAWRDAPMVCASCETKEQQP
jgi:hypothetical protein